MLVSGTTLMAGHSQNCQRCPGAGCGCRRSAQLQYRMIGGSTGVVRLWQGFHTGFIQTSFRLAGDFELDNFVFVQHVEDRCKNL